MKPHLYGQPSSRALRRASKRAPRSKPVRPVHIPMLIKADYVLSPLEAVISQIELRGTVDAIQDGTPVFRAPDGYWYPLAGALQGVINLFEQWSIRHQQPIDLAALRQLHARIDYVMPIDQGTLDNVREILPTLRRIASRMDPADAQSLVLGTQIQAELEDA